MMRGKLRRAIGIAGLLALSLSSFGGSSFGQTKKIPGVEGFLAGRVTAQYANLKSWSATYSATRTENGTNRVTNPSGTVVFTAPSSLVVTPSGKDPIFGSCAEPGALTFLCNFSGMASLHVGDDPSGLVLAGKTAKRTAPSEVVIFYIEPNTYDVLGVTTFDDNGNRSRIAFTNVSVEH